MMVHGASCPSWVRCCRKPPCLLCWPPRCRPGDGWPPRRSALGGPCHGRWIPDENHVQLDWRLWHMVRQVLLEGIALGYLHASIVGSLTCGLDGRPHVCCVLVLPWYIITMFVGVATTLVDTLQSLCWRMLFCPPPPYFAHSGGFLPSWLLLLWCMLCRRSCTTCWSSLVNALPPWAPLCFFVVSVSGLDEGAFHVGSHVLSHLVLAWHVWRLSGFCYY